MASGDTIEARVGKRRLLAALLHAPPPPVTLGRFELQARLGAGAMGTVFAARDPELDRDVAIKVLHDRTDAARLTAEARTLARLSHPNIVTIHEIGTEGDTTFIVMERARGVTAGEWLCAQPRQWREIVALYLHAGRALLAAHTHGVVHCDVKPDNILVDAGGSPRLVDFGLGCFAGASGGAGNAVAGTPRFVAPEVLAGNNPDARADQFSWCVALDDALGPSVERSSMRRSVRRAIARGMHHDPDARWPSLDPILTLLERSVAPARHARWSSVGLAVALLGGGVIAWQVRGPADACASGTRPELSQRSTMRAALPLLEDHLSRWTATHELLCRAYGQADAIPRRASLCLWKQQHTFDTVTTALVGGELDADAVQQAAASLPAPEDCVAFADAPAPESRDTDDAVERDLATGIGLALVTRGEEAEEIFLGAEQRAKAGGFRATLVRVQIELGALVFARNDTDSAQRRLTDAFWSAESLGLSGEASEAAVLLSIVVPIHAGNPTQAALWARLAQAHAEKPGVPAYRRIQALAQRAVLAGEEHDSDQALELSGAVRGALRQGLEMPILVRFALLVATAEVAAGAGEIDAAVAWMDEAVALARGVFGDRHTVYANALSVRGLMLFGIDRHAEAAQAFGDELALRPETMPSTRAAARINLAAAIAKTGDLRRALGESVVALAELQAGSTLDSNLLALVHNNLADLYVRLGDADTAWEHIQIALPLYTRMMGPDSVDLVEPLTVAGATQLERGEIAAAREYLEHAQRLLSSAEPRVHERYQPLVSELRARLREAAQ